MRCRVCDLDMKHPNIEETHPSCRGRGAYAMRPEFDRSCEFCGTAERVSPVQQGRSWVYTCNDCFRQLEIDDPKVQREGVNRLPTFQHPRRRKFDPNYFDMQYGSDYRRNPVTYRRNADSQLRQLERALAQEPTADNLIRYNRELTRSGMPPMVASEAMVSDALKSLLQPHFRVWGITELQFPGLEVKKDILDDTYPMFPKNKEQFEEIDALLRSAIPLLLGLGWVALVQQEQKVVLRIKKNEYDEYVVQWIEGSRVNEDKSSYHSDRDDAEATLLYTKSRLVPSRYPELLTVPRTVMQPSGRPIVPPQDSRAELIADQWKRYVDPRSLEDPLYRRGTLPVAIILVKRPEETYSRGKDYVTWHYYVSYEGREPSAGQGHYDLTLEEAKLDYLCRLLAVGSNSKYTFQLFD